VHWRELGEVKNECTSYNFRQFAIFVQKLADLVEVWRSYNKNNFACFLRHGVDSIYLFVSTAVETLGPFNVSSCQLLTNLGRKIFQSSGNDREGSFLFQRISMLLQHFDAIFA